jgi:hypothetical protein
MNYRKLSSKQKVDSVMSGNRNSQFLLEKELKKLSNEKNKRKTNDIQRQNTRDTSATYNNRGTDLMRLLT